MSSTKKGFEGTKTPRAELTRENSQAGSLGLLPLV